MKSSQYNFTLHWSYCAYMLIKAKIKYWQPQKCHSLTYFTHLQFYKSHIPKLAENAFIFSCHRPELGRGSQRDRTANTLLYNPNYLFKNSLDFDRKPNSLTLFKP